MIQTKKNNAQGVINFDKINYKEAGTFGYTISEVKGNAPGITYDDRVINVKVVVKEEGSELVATASYEGGQTFSNTYEVKSGSTVLTAKKEQIGKELLGEDYEFELKDSEGKVIQTKKNNAQGVINFDKINYKEAGTFGYTISEVKGNAPGITYDDRVINVKVVVKEEGSELVATASYEGGQTFSNTYEVKSGSTVLTAKKEQIGKELLGEDYEFELKDSEGKVIQTKKNNAQGVINFDKINYKEAGTFGYTISEVKGNAPGITYDDRVINVKVVVKEEGSELVAAASYEGGQTFSNTYEPDSPINKIFGNKLPKAGEINKMSFVLLGLFLIIVVIVGYYYKIKKVK